MTVNSARQAFELLRRGRGRGVTVLTADEVVVEADVPEVPVGIDGETVMMPTPVRCTIRPRALRCGYHATDPASAPRSPPSTGRRCANWPRPGPHREDGLIQKREKKKKKKKERG